MSHTKSLVCRKHKAFQWRVLRSSLRWCAGQARQVGESAAREAALGGLRGPGQCRGVRWRGKKGLPSHAGGLVMQGLCPGPILVVTGRLRVLSRRYRDLAYVGNCCSGCCTEEGLREARLEPGASRMLPEREAAWRRCPGWASVQRPGAGRLAGTPTRSRRGLLRPLGRCPQASRHQDMPPPHAALLLHLPAAPRHPCCTRVVAGGPLGTGRRLAAFRVLAARVDPRVASSFRECFFTGPELNTVPDPGGAEVTLPLLSWSLQPGGGAPRESCCREAAVGGSASGGSGGAGLELRESHKEPQGASPVAGRS